MNRQKSVKVKPSVAGNRALRAHNRDAERKKMRDETFTRHRNLSAMSPLRENRVNVKVVDNRKLMLMKWKAERELHKKLQQRERSKNPIFKVTRVEAEVIAFSRPVPQIKRVTVPVDVPEPRVTRSSVCAKKPPAARTRSSATTTTKVSVPSVVVGKRPSTRATKGKAAQEAAPLVQPTRRQGQPSVATVASAKVLPPMRKKMSKPTDGKLTTAKQGRADPSLSFAPDNFKFAPPANLSTPVFSPLSPVSAVGFMLSDFDAEAQLRGLEHVSLFRGRCSTPKVTSRITPCVHSPAESVIMKVTKSVTEKNRLPESSSASESVSENDVSDKDDEVLELATSMSKATTSLLNGTLPSIKEEGSPFVDRANVTLPELSHNEPDTKGNDENMPPPSSTAVVRTPGRALRQRRHTAGGELRKSSESSCRRTPKCNSLVLKNLSPEDTINVLLDSPMVEVRRRTKKVHTLDATLELPDFEDMDLSIAADTDQAAAVVTSGDADLAGGDMAVKDGDTALDGVDTALDGVDTAGAIGDTAMTCGDTGGAIGDAALAGGDTAVTSVDTAGAIGDAALEDGNTAVKDGDTGGDTACTGNDIAVKDGDMEVGDTATTVTASDDTADPGAKTDSDVTSEHDVSYYRRLIISETERLTTECGKWDAIDGSTDNLSDDVEGQIRTTVGQAQLLMRQRFKQFSGLVDNCEFGTGGKITLCSDLQGFWDMVYFQVEDVDSKFVALSKLRSNGWVQEQVERPKRKAVSKKPAAKKRVAGGKSKFGAFLAKMKQQKVTDGEKEPAAVGKEECVVVGTGESARKGDDIGFGKVEDTTDKAEEDGAVVETEGGAAEKMAEEKLKTFDGGFFSVSSPVVSPSLLRKDGRRSSAKKSLSQPGSKNGSRANTPGGTTSSGKSLLILSVMKRISQSAQRRSSSPRLSGGDSPLSATRGLPTTPSGVSAGCRMRPRRSLAVSAQPATPEVFSPAANTDATDRSGKRESAERGSVDMARFLVPTKVTEREESMDVDVLQSSPPEDVDMSAAMKRNLSAEFDGQSASKGRRSGAVTPLSGAITPRSTMKRRRSVTGSSCRRSSRRTVHFVDASDSPACERLPVTPFNKNSRVPRKRSNSSGYHGDSSNDVPVRKLAKLTVEHTPTPARAGTPQKRMPHLHEADEDDLMSFNPVAMSLSAMESPVSTTPSRTPRRSTRLSLL